VHELVRTILIYVAVLALIVGGFYLFKQNRYKIQMEATDRSMSPEYQTGSYNVITGAAIQADDAVVFALPEKPDEWRAGRVVAMAGARVEIDEKGLVKVNGAAHRTKCESQIRPVEFVVPAACVFVLTDQPGYIDSVKLGPIPLYQVIGKLKPGV